MEFNKPYKITLWEEVTTYLVEHSNGSIETVTSISDGDVVLNSWTEELCIATIGSDTMDSPVRIFDPKFTQEINGKKTLTFSLAMRYWDYEEEDFKNNPFVGLLVNERKIKLYYDNEWYDFFLKERTENSEKYIFDYSCEDIYLTELGRNGYKVELKTELENNVGTALTLGEKILEDTDWEVAPVGDGPNNSDLIVQTVKEGFYLFTVESSFTAKCIKDFEYNDIFVPEGTTKQIQSGSTIYIFYSTFVNQEKQIQFYFVDNGAYSIDEHGFIVNSPNWSFTPDSLPSFYGVSQEMLDDPNRFQLNMSSYFGKKVTRLQENIYVPAISRTCSVYCTESNPLPLYYCYKEPEHSSVEETQNLLVNSEGFLDTYGWGSYSAEINAYLPTNGELNGQMSLLLNLSPGWVAYSSFNEAERDFNAGKRVYYLDNERYILVRKTETLISSITYYKNETCYNTGFFNNRQLLTEMVASDEDVFVLKLLVDSPDDPQLNALRAAVYAEEVTSEAVANDLLIDFSGPHTIDSEGYFTIYGKVKRSLSYTTLLDTYTNITFYLLGDGTYSIAKALCFKKVLDSNGELIVPDLQKTANSIVRNKYYFFTRDQINSLVTSVDDLEFAAVQYDETGFVPYYPPSMGKTTMIEVEKSNYFNLIQTICEKFECWAKFIIGHDNNGKILTYYVPTVDTERKAGKIYYKFRGDGTPTEEDRYNHTLWQIDTTSSVGILAERRAAKTVAFKEYVGIDNAIGFRYGINLKSVIRKVRSDAITTKLIVEENSNEFAKDKSCSIQKAALNPSGENFLFNFQYFINHKLIDEAELNKDLYGSIDKTGIALLPNLHKLNSSAEKYIREKPNLSDSIMRIKNSLLILENQEISIAEKMSKLNQYIEASGYADISPELLNKFDYLKRLYTQLQYNNAVSVTYVEIIKNLNDLLESYEGKFFEVETRLNLINEQKQRLLKEFYKKYSNYIREGTWISEDYYDEDRYYLDAQMVLYTSAFPQIEYTINSIEISKLEGYEPYKFGIGDKTYMEDTEFFGWDSMGRPYKEDIVVSKVVYHLDDSSQNVIEVKNYKTQFEDLFQRIAAETQSLQYHSGEYKRAADAITLGYTLDGVLLQNSLKNNELIIQNAYNQAVTWGDDGITISNSRLPNEIVRMTSNGIVLSTDGGQSWHTGISATGINADVITTGQLDTNLIRIFNADKQTFQWNSSGINAYAQNAVAKTVDYNTFVRFDQYGVYGLKGDPNWDPDYPPDGEYVGLEKVKKDAYFSLTWDGLRINIQGSDENTEVVNINKGNFLVRGDGSIEANNGVFRGDVYATDGTFSGTLSAAKVSGALTSNGDGWLEGIGIRTGSDGNDPPYYNFYVGSNGEVKAGGDAVNGPNFHVDTNGNVTIKGNVTLDSNSVIQWSNLSTQTQNYVTSAQADATQALSDASDALSAAEGAEIVSSTIIWQYKSSKSTPTAPTSEVTYTGSFANRWTLNKPGYNSNYIYYYYCYQQEMGDGSFTFTDVMYDAGTSGVYAIASGNFDEAGTTFISDKTIYSPSISGGTLTGAVVAGGEFTNLQKGPYLKLGVGASTQQFGDLAFCKRTAGAQAADNDTKVFYIYDQVSGMATIGLYERPIITGGNSGTTSNPITSVTAEGNWNFVNNPTGVYARFG